MLAAYVALRKESVDRNGIEVDGASYDVVALRKESVDRNKTGQGACVVAHGSLSARRAWIEIIMFVNLRVVDGSLSARRAWIEI